MAAGVRRTAAHVMPAGRGAYQPPPPVVVVTQPPSPASAHTVVVWPDEQPKKRSWGMAIAPRRMKRRIAR